MVWLDYDDKYSISHDGQVMNKKTLRILKQGKNGHTNRTKRDDYYCIVLYGKTVKVHRLVALLFLPKIDIPNLQVDHINQNSLDNNASNLRWVSATINQINKGVMKNNTSGYKNISYCKKSNKWKIFIRREGISKNYGSFDKIEDAVKKRDSVYNALQS